METGSLIGFGQLGVYTLLSYLFVKKYGSHLNDTDRKSAIWFGFNAACHLLFEGLFVFLSFNGEVNNHDWLIALPWKEYEKADTRWGIFDPATVALEMWTVFICGPLSLALVWAIIKNNRWRHPMQVVLCVSELYGGWMTFGPEWIIASPHLRTHTFTLLWSYLIIPNMVWVVIPLILLWDSLKHYFALLEGTKPRKAPQPRTPSTRSPPSPTSASTEVVVVAHAPKSPKSPSTKKVAAKTTTAASTAKAAASTPAKSMGSPKMRNKRTAEW